jgi:hypothetical protein
LTVSGGNVGSRQSTQKSARIGGKSQTGISDWEDTAGISARIQRIDPIEHNSTTEFPHGRETPDRGSRLLQRNVQLGRRARNDEGAGACWV